MTGQALSGRRIVVLGGTGGLGPRGHRAVPGRRRVGRGRRRAAAARGSPARGRGVRHRGRARRGQRGGGVRHVPAAAGHRQPDRRVHPAAAAVRARRLGAAAAARAEPGDRGDRHQARHAGAGRAGRRGARARVQPGGGGKGRERVRLQREQARGGPAGRGGGRGGPRAGGAGQLHHAEHHRHPGQPGGDAGRQAPPVAQAVSAGRRARLPGLGRGHPHLRGGHPRLRPGAGAGTGRRSWPVRDGRGHDRDGRARTGPGARLGPGPRLSSPAVSRVLRSSAVRRHAATIRRSARCSSLRARRSARSLRAYRSCSASCSRLRVRSRTTSSVLMATSPLCALCAVRGRAAHVRRATASGCVAPFYAATSVLRGRPRGRLRGTIAPRISSSPPQTPQGSLRSSAPVRQASLASQPRHIALAVSTSSGDSAKNSSGSSVHGRSRPTGSAAAELPPP